MNILHRVAPLVLVLLPLTARADILMLDVNDQDGERRAVQRLATEFGEDANFVVGSKTKDFLVLLEAEFARAERGESSVETIVFSGHSVTGQGFFSTDHDREIVIDDLKVLAAKYPKAFAQVRHVMLMGCMAGASDDINDWSKLFPNVTMAAGFNGSGPSFGAANRFLKQVLREVERAETEAGGADEFAAILAADEAAVDAWSKTLASLDAVRLTNYGLDVCGSYLTRVKLTKNTPERLKELLNDAYLTCRDADVQRCPDPRRWEDELRELYMGTESFIRPKSVNTAFVDSQQRKVYKLIHYDAFVTTWVGENRVRLDAAAKRVNGFPDAATFASSNRREQLDAIQTLRGSADPSVSTLAADLQRELAELRD